MRSRLLYMIGLAAVAVPLAAASVAYACTSLATINLSPGSGPAGTTVTVTGKGFVPHDSSSGTPGNAYVRFDSQRGPILAEATPAGSGGRFTVEIQIPQSADPGNHVILATQNRADGSPAGGTPARQAFTVTAPAQAEAPPAAVTPQPRRPGRQAASPAPQGDAPAAATPSQPATSGRAAASSEPARAPRGGVSGAVDAPGSSPTAAGAAPASLGPPGGTGTAPGAVPAAGAATDRAGAPGSADATADRRFGAPAPAPVGGPRSMMSPGSGPSTLLAMLLVGFGLLLTLGGGALVAAHRRGVDVPALARSFLRR